MTARPTPSPWLVLATVLIGTFVGTLGNSASNITLPAVMDTFGVSLDSAVWVVTVYVLTFAVLMPVCGYLGDLFGWRQLYLLGMGLFTLGSLASGLAPTFTWLLLARITQGIGIAPTLPGVMTLIAQLFPGGRRGQAMGFWALVNGAGHAAGPALGGVISQHLGWRGVFMAGVPLCALCLVAVWQLAPPDGKRSAQGFDLAGAGTLTVAVLGMMIALTQSARWGWISTSALALWGLALAAAVAFFIIERNTRAPFVDLALFANRRYRAAMVVIASQFFCLFGMALALPIYLIQGQGLNSQTAGLLVFALPLTMGLTAPPAGRLADRYGSRLTCTAGMGLVVLTALGWLLLGIRSEPAVVGYLVLMGIGMGLTQSPVTAAVTRVVPAAKVGVATGIFHMGRFVSGTLGSTVFGLILQTQPHALANGFERDLVVLATLAGVGALAANWLPGRATCRQAQDVGFQSR